VNLRGHAHALKCILDGWLVVAANAGSHDPVHVLYRVIWDLGLANLGVTSRTLISKPFS
jgi:hypothetical protein